MVLLVSNQTAAAINLKLALRLAAVAFGLLYDADDQGIDAASELLTVFFAEHLVVIASAVHQSVQWIGICVHASEARSFQPTV